MTLRDVHVILNPASGGGRAGAKQEDIVRELEQRGVRVVLHKTRAPKHATELAQQLAEAGVEVIGAAGGDGTVHDVANGIVRSGKTTALAVIPTGTGNDFAKVVPGAHSIETAYDTIAHAQLKSYDVGHARWTDGEEYFTNGMGMGVDVEVVRQIERSPRLPGTVKYLLGLVRALASYDAIALVARAPGETIERRVMMMAVGNGVCQGGGFYLTPRARPDDGLLDLCVVHAMPWWQLPTGIAAVLRGTHEGLGTVTMRKVQNVRFEAPSLNGLFFQVDGELRESSDNWVEVSVMPRALNVVTAMETTE